MFISLFCLLQLHVVQAGIILFFEYEPPFVTGITCSCVKLFVLPQ